MTTKSAPNTVLYNRCMSQARTWIDASQKIREEQQMARATGETPTQTPPADLAVGWCLLFAQMEFPKSFSSLFFSFRFS